MPLSELHCHLAANAHTSTDYDDCTVWTNAKGRFIFADDECNCVRDQNDQESIEE